MLDKNVNIEVKTRRDNYPPEFYQVLEKIDIIARNYIGDTMGSSGVDELYILAGIFAIDWHLSYDMPNSARAFFYELVNPKKAWDYHQKNNNVFGGFLKAYADLRQFLIDNAERVTVAYEILLKERSEYYDR